MDTQTSHQPTKRVEDDYLLRGTGRYMADAPLPGQTYACFVRSQHACADIKSIDTKAALAIKGVIAVITAADIKAANVGNLSQHPPVAGRGGTKLIMPVRPALAGDRVRHTGEAVAMVIGETFAAAQDGAEGGRGGLRSGRCGVRSARRREAGRAAGVAGSAGQHRGRLGRPCRQPRRTAAKVDEVMKSAAHVARISLVHQRINVASMEPRGGTASYDAANESYLLASARKAPAPCATRWPA
jgi:carbon-monoxide dehydrogenase large subunit